MEKEMSSYSAAAAEARGISFPWSCFNNPIHHHNKDDDDDDGDDDDDQVQGAGVVVDYRLLNHNNPYDGDGDGDGERQQQQPINGPMLSSSSSMPSCVERTLSFADVMQFADFGPKLARGGGGGGGGGVDDDHVSNYLLKFPVLNDNDNDNQLIMSSSANNNNNTAVQQLEFLGGGGPADEDLVGVGAAAASVGEVHEHADGGMMMMMMSMSNNKQGATPNKRKRPRSVKTSEEVESQRMTHIAVERNRRKQMNEHLRVLRSLMPSSYVQRGDQASIIGGAIEFVRELEQLLQCLESQKRRRLYGDPTAPAAPPSSSSDIIGGGNNTIINSSVNHHQNNNNVVNDCEGGTSSSLLLAGLQEESAESKSGVADVEVRVAGLDGLIKVLSRRRPGQLLRAISALEDDLRLTVLHTNITTIDHTVLYSFNVKIIPSPDSTTAAPPFTAHDIAASVQQVFSYIHANSHLL